ncbi:MAG: hypothetical protein A2Y10_15685 [Planctomycetes bacterium GWF2_41_51]|nr:MAG: hypothetical protein A2Y10_15685 [Planctomycetes bacterium GWF2_41_51]HBG27627.1 hypothetical protein [Phycisphaerales bacterium]
MKQATETEEFDGVEIPASARLKRQRRSRYGSIADLDSSELIEPAEIERIYLKSEFAPILALPVKTRKGWIRPNVDEDGTIELGAFGTVDFDRYVNFDKARYKAEKLKEELFHERLMMELISGQIKTMAKYKIIKYVSTGILDVEDISDVTMYCLAKRYLRMRRLQSEIAEIVERSNKRRQAMAEKFFESLD